MKQTRLHQPTWFASLGRIPIYLHLHLSGYTASLVWAWLRRLDCDDPGLATAAMFFFTGWIYAVNSMTDLKEDHINLPQRARFYERWGGYIVGVYSMGVVGTMVMLIRHPFSVALMIGTVVIGTLYSIPGLPAFSSSGIRWVKLKNVFVLKTLCTGLFEFISYFFAFSFAEVVPGIHIWTTGLLLFALGLATTFIGDLRDAHGDGQAGVVTVATVFGQRRTKALIVALVVGVIVVSALLRNVTRAPCYGVMLMTAATFLVLLCTVLRWSRPGATAHDLAVDCHVPVFAAWLAVSAPT